MKLRLLIFSCVLWVLPFCIHAAAIAPAVLDVSGNRGEVVSSEFTVINASEKDQTYYLGTLSFKPKDDSGEPLFSSEVKKEGMATWIQFESDHVIVPARSKAEVAYKIHVPADAPSGTVQAAITVSGAPSEVVATNGAVIEAKTAMLVFLTVNGESIKKAALLDFTRKGSVIESNLSSHFQFRIQDQGNVYAIPTGVIDIKDVFGRTLKTFKVNEEHYRILPMTTRTFDIKEERANGFMNTIRAQYAMFAMGPMTAVLQVNLGDGFEPIHATTTFWYIPYQLVLFVLALLLIIFVGFTNIAKRKKT